MVKQTTEEESVMCLTRASLRKMEYLHKQAEKYGIPTTNEDGSPRGIFSIERELIEKRRENGVMNLSIEKMEALVTAYAEKHGIEIKFSRERGNKNV